MECLIHSLYIMNFWSWLYYF